MHFGVNLMYSYNPKKKVVRPLRRHSATIICTLYNDIIISVHVRMTVLKQVLESPVIERRVLVHQVLEIFIFFTEYVYFTYTY